MNFLHFVVWSFICHFSCLLYTTISISIEVSYDSRALKINGERRLIISGAIHYPRSTPEMWPELMKKAKEGGINTIETYIFWDLHEPIRRQYDFRGRKDFVRFFKTMQTLGLYGFLRIGPYVCAEWNYGGFPMWLHNLPGIKLRTNNQVYKDEMATFTKLIVDMCKKESLFASQGGPIILAQIENEYGNIMKPYKTDGTEYIKWCSQLAQAQNIAEPWIMCQQADAPEPMINTCNGYYCDSFIPNRPTSPKFWTENWSGWYKAWGESHPHRPVEDLAYAVARFFQKGGSLQNYYMYHGGTDFGRTAGGPFMATSYDYDAPLDEYGNIYQPKWGHLKHLHELLYSMENNLLQGEPRTQALGTNVEATIYSTGVKSSCFIANNDSAKDTSVTFQGKHYSIPAWSVSILPDCNQEVYNTAKVNTQTNVKMVMKSSGGEAEQGLPWLWRVEPFKNLKSSQLQGDFSLNRLIDQKEANDTSDYLWYMTSITVDETDPLLGAKVTLRVDTKGGHVLHSFLNGRYKTSTLATRGNYHLIFDTPLQLVKGVNNIAILSITVGFQNYGPFFDEAPAGIVGTVQLLGTKDNETVTRDLSTNQWFYKVGLDGEKRGVFKPETSAKMQSHSSNLALGSKFTWYKTTFKSPYGKDPVIMDFAGMGKGHAWVNGNSIGRYWPSFLGNADGCHECDYRGGYTPEKCRTNCGNATQRWYHVPRSFLNPSGENTLIMFEEYGGNPTYIKIQTSSVDKICANPYEGATFVLTCPSTIKEIKFASFGDPTGVCGGYKKGICESTSAFSTINKACVGKPTCTINVSEATLGPTGCTGVPIRRLAMEATCG